MPSSTLGSPRDLVREPRGGRPPPSKGRLRRAETTDRRLNEASGQTNAKPVARHFENLLHLKAIVDAGSINRASTIIGLSQPALTRSIGKLEAAVGAQLLTRVAKGVYPTECGRALLDHVRAAEAELEHARTELRIFQSRSASQLACGGTFVSASFLIPLAIKEFCEGLPGENVRLMEGTTDALLRMLRLGELEVVVCPKMDTLSDNDLVSEALVTERVGIFAGSGHALAGQSSHQLKKLAATEKWIVPDRSGQLRQLLVSEFNRHSVDLPKCFVEISSLVAAQQLLTLTPRILFSTSLLMTPDFMAGAAVELMGDWNFPTTTMTIFHRNQVLSPSGLHFVKCLRRIASS